MIYDIGNLALLPIRSNDDFSRRLANHFGLSDPDKLVINNRNKSGKVNKIMLYIVPTYVGWVVSSMRKT